MIVSDQDIILVRRNESLGIETQYTTTASPNRGTIGNNESHIRGIEQAYDIYKRVIVCGVGTPFVANQG